MMLRALTATILTLAATAAAADPAFDFRTHFDAATRGYVLVTSKEDRVAIKRVEINRGACAALNPDQLPSLPTLGFGQSLKVGFDKCVPIEVKVETDKGIAAVSNADGRTGLVAEVRGHDPHDANVARLFIFNYSTDPVDIADYDGIDINRGNCRHHTDVWRSKLRFGEYILAFAFCDPIEVTVRTDKGKVTLSPQ